MKKEILFTMTMLVSMATSVNAQEFRYGITGGYNLNSSVANNSMSGFHAGLKGEYSFKNSVKGLYTDFGLLLSSHGWTSDTYYISDSQESVEYKCTPYYLNIPIHIGYKLKLNDNVSMFINAGPYFNIGMFGKMKKNISSPLNDEYTVTTSNNVFKDKAIERFDWGVGFRLGVEIARHLQIGIGYDWGMKSTYNNNPDTRNRTLVVSCSYIF